MTRVGLVGFGLGGRVLHAPVIAAVEGLELAAVVERTTHLAAERYPGICVHRSLESLLADASIDLVVITTPSATHFQMAQLALQAGKHLVVDKPVCLQADQVAELMQLAQQKNRLLIPYHNRHWDSEFRTVEQLLQNGSLGRIVDFHSAIDRWRPGATRTPWKDDANQGGGRLYDLGAHLVYQTLALFGLPEAVSAEVVRERDGEGADDAFTLRLRYPGMMATLESTNLAAMDRPRFYLRGTAGSYRKQGADVQEEALKQITRISDPHWGMEPKTEWGKLTLDVEGKLVSLPVEPLPGDYRIFYRGVRDALQRLAAPPVQALEAWQTIRILELALQASHERREVVCLWNQPPA